MSIETDAKALGVEPRALKKFKREMIADGFDRIAEAASDSGLALPSHRAHLSARVRTAGRHLQDGKDDMALQAIEEAQYILIETHESNRRIHGGEGLRTVRALLATVSLALEAQQTRIRALED